MVSLAEATLAFGPPHAPHAEVGGPEPTHVWLFGFECGLEVALWMGAVEEQGLAVRSNDADIDHCLGHLPLLRGRERDRVDRLDVAWSDLPRAEPFTVHRQDDNGNQFEVRRCRSRRAAECLAKSLSAGSHKQHYWVSPTTSEG